MENLNKIESVLLKQELGIIQTELSKVGKNIAEIFQKYGPIEGRHKKELAEYIQTCVLSAKESYYSGSTTTPFTNSYPSYLPDCIKKVILDWAVKEFFKKLEDVQNIVGGLQE